MSTGKRNRSLEDVDGDVDVQSASSNLRQSHQKRSRIALARENGGSVVSDEEDYDMEEQQQHTDHDCAPRDPSDDEVEEDVFDELRATQIIQKQMRQHKDNIASEHGIIEEVFCRNFMCHTKLRIKLGPLINFIIGHNGSGKSAVLTALTMCLGGKATTSNRGANLKSLIKAGQESAVLAVKIKNQGEGAYKPDLYGKSIIVERHFSRSSSSGFKIKNEQEKVISTRRADLDDILDYFAFQLDNPINVLSQDMARQFLSSSTPRDKYKFFIRGTQLEVLDNDYNVMEENLDSQEETLRLREEDLDILKTKVKDAEAKKKRIDSAEAIMGRIRSMQHQHAWAQIAEQEDILDRHERDVEVANMNVGEKEEASQEIFSAYEGYNQSCEAAERAVEAQKQNLDPARNNHDTEKKTWDDHFEEITTLNAEQRAIKDTITSAKSNITRLNGEIEQEQERLAGVHGTAHTDRLNSLEELKAAAEDARQAHFEHSRGAAELDRARVTAAQAHDAALPEQEKATAGLRSAKATLQQLQGSSGNPFAGYHESVRRAVQEINRETRWRSKPVGPFGQHIHLLKPEWSSQLETTFGNQLSAFGVTNKEDQDILHKILKRTNCLSQVYKGSAEPLDTTGKEPESDHDTILKVLRFDNDLVRNTLIINTAVEQTVLIKDQQEAYRYMYGSGRPRNVRAVISMATERGSGVRNEYSRAGAQKTSTVRPYTGTPRLKTDREDQLRIQQQRVNDARKEEDEAIQHTRALQTTRTRADQALTRFKRQSKELLAAHQRADDTVEAMQAEIDNNRPQDGRLQELERQARDVKEELENAQSSYQDSVVEKDRLGAIGRNLKARLDEAEKELAEVGARITKAENRKSKLEQDRFNALLKKNEVVDAIDHAKQTVTRLEGKRDRQRETVADHTRQATSICQRVPLDEGVTTEILDNRISKLEQDYQKVQRDAGGTREELTRAWKKAAMEYDNARKQTEEMTKTATALKESLTERHRRWGLFRKYISARARINFGYLLSERSFRGRVILDHNDKKLDISVEPDLAKISDAGRQAKTLSGGEKSFSTICLLLSIWEAMGSPIRCLDEFDVFMDSVNRATSMGMMIQAARRSVGRQFILITPQSMNNVELGDDVKIHRMSDPERGQTALAFGE